MKEALITTASWLNIAIVVIGLVIARPDLVLIGTASLLLILFGDHYDSDNT